MENRDIKESIKSAVSKRMKESQEFLFEGIDHYESKTLDEFFESNNVKDYVWDEDLEGALYDMEDLHEAETTDQSKVFKVGDIIMTTLFQSKGSQYQSPHRVLVVTTKTDHEGVTTYEGFLLSSKIDKSNKLGKYPNNIYINNYSTILYKGTPYNKEAFIRVDDIVKFTSNDLSTRGSWKGSVTREFMEFVQKCVDNYRKGISNSDMHWEK